MTALVKERATRAIPGGPIPTSEGGQVAASTTLWAGGLVGKNASGLYVPAGPLAQVVTGRASKTVINPSGGTKRLNLIEYGVFHWVNGDSIAATDIGKAAYALDDQTIQKAAFSSTGARLPFAGVIYDVDANGVWVMTGPSVNGQVFIIERQILHTTVLTAAATSQTISLGTTPRNTHVLGSEVLLATPVAGGTISACVVDVGPAGDVDAIIDGSNVFAAAVNGKASTKPSGIAPQGSYGNVELNATVIATGGNLSTATAGDFTVRLYCVIR